MASDPFPIVPGHALGFITLGAALQQVLSMIKADKSRYPEIELHITRLRPLQAPVVVNLPQNGIRLRFDAADQRLRLIEVLDFKKSQFTYKSSDLVKRQDVATFKRIYQIFGASYPGEYIPPKDGEIGTYVLSWPGISFTFPLQDSAWSEKKDHVSLLSSHAASPATTMALFEGNSWPEVRHNLFVGTPSGLRAPAIDGEPRDALPAEIETAVIRGNGQVILFRRDADRFHIRLGETTPQDLLTELGPPDTYHKRDAQQINNLSAHTRTSSVASPPPNGRTHATPPSSYSSTGTDTFDTDFESGEPADDDPAARAERETFWCYFGHGMDILVGPPNEFITPGDDPLYRAPITASPHLVVLKVVIHGNVPGSYAFNRHRRLRWRLELIDVSRVLHSEHGFNMIRPELMRVFANSWPESELGRGKVVNRTWGAGPSDSTFFLPDADEELEEEGGKSEQWLGNTKLYSFPGLAFEVMPNGAVCALTVS